MTEEHVKENTGNVDLDLDNNQHHHHHSTITTTTTIIIVVVIIFTCQKLERQAAAGVTWRG